MRRQMLFDTEMVRAILNGKKTVTRRLASNKQRDRADDQKALGLSDNAVLADLSCELPCKKGDLIYVREAWAETPEGVVYKADGEPEDWGRNDVWQPSIYMPQEYARIFLRVTDVYPQRILDIYEQGEKGALEEGVPNEDEFPIPEVFCPSCHGKGEVEKYDFATFGRMMVPCCECDNAVKRFRNHWNSNARLFSDRFEQNPFVFVIKFEVAKVRKNVPCTRAKNG